MQLPAQFDVLDKDAKYDLSLDWRLVREEAQEREAHQKEHKGRLVARPVIHPREGPEGRQKIGRDEGYRWVKGLRKEVTKKSVALLRANQEDIPGKIGMHVYRLESFAPCAKCQVTEPLRCREGWNFVDPLIQLV